jgi:hypothetical protein
MIKGSVPDAALLTRGSICCAARDLGRRRTGRTLSATQNYARQIYPLSFK